MINILHIPSKLEVNRVQSTGDVEVFCQDISIILDREEAIQLANAILEQEEFYND
jgi:hypothetical protein